MTNKIITRFAPSPTGFLHIGGARTALFNWVFAKKHGGEMLLRIEDTDRARYSEEAKRAIEEGLKWLGLDWGGEAVSQYQRRDRHREIAHELVEKGLAYKCYCSAEELSEMRAKAREAGLPPRYDGRWRDADPALAPEGVAPSIRIKVPTSGTIVVHDHVQGDVTFECANLDDFIILRSDGSPTYMLAVVVDDHDMNVTHIIRGDDHLTNAARQIVIFNAMQWDVPQMTHVPLIHGPDGAKLSKRHGAMGVDAYRKMGYLPAAVRNYLARLGWSHGDDEFFSTEQMIEWFSLEGLNKGASRFDFVKLENLNGQHIREEKPAYLFAAMVELAEELGNHSDKAGLLAHKETVISALPELQPRAKTVLELITLAQFIYAERPLLIEEKASKHLNENTRAMLIEIIALLEIHANWEAASLQQLVRDFGEQKELKLGKVAQPMRVALTGRTVSPGVFEVMELLGKSESLERLKDQAVHP